MKIKKIIYGVAISCLAIMPVMSQVEKEVEVTQAFIPQIKPSVKPTILPDMTDDAYINPDIDYSITPISIHTQIDVTPYKPVEMDYWEYKKQQNYYAKLGLGLPISAVADIYASTSSLKGYAVGYLNYDGSYADIENDYGVSSNAGESHLRVGSSAGLYVGDRILDGSVNYENDRWSRYATDVASDKHPLYQRFGLDLRYGDSFLDWSGWNYAISGGLEYMWSSTDFKNTSFVSRFDLGHELYGGNLLFSAIFDYVGGSDSYKNNTFGASLIYGKSWDRLGLSVGLDFYHDGISFDPNSSNIALPIAAEQGTVKGYDSNFVIPHVELNYQISSTRVIGYIEVDGDVVKNNFASLSSRNPYIEAGLFGAKNSIEYDFAAGIKGTIADKRLGYNIGCQYYVIKDNMYWALLKSAVDSSDCVNNGFVSSLSDKNGMNLIFSTDYRPNSNLLFELEAQIVISEDDKELQQWEDGMTNSEFRLSGKYSVGRWNLGLNCEVLSKRTFSVVDYGVTGSSLLSAVDIPSTVNLGLNVDYTLESRWVVFADITNILNDDLYEWVGYREYGIGAMVGVKFEF